MKPVSLLREKNGGTPAMAVLSVLKSGRNVSDRVRSSLPPGVNTPLGPRPARIHFGVHQPCQSGDV